MKIKVAVAGTVGRTVTIDPNPGPAILAQVRALLTQAGLTGGGARAHNQLTGLGADDHPQYTMWQAPETILGLWNFATLPKIDGTFLDEFIEDTIGLALLDSPSIRLNYFDYGNTDGKIEAEIVDEYVEDLVGRMLLDSPSINLTYFDYGSTDGKIEATINDEYVEDLVGSMFIDSETIDFTYYDYGGSHGRIQADVRGLQVDTDGAWIVTEETTFLDRARFDTSIAAGETRFMVYDVDNATLERVTVGAADSGGVGFKVLRIPN